MCSGSSSLRSTSVRSGFGCKGGLDPRRYRGQSRHGSSQFSAAQHGADFGAVLQHRCAQHCNLARS
eukprot:7716981-Pyramimonas_sp.AAC.1